MLSIIIVSFNTKELLDKCLNSLLKDKSIQREIIVVDNGSEDGTTEMVKRKYPSVKIIENRENQGFAKANNLALRQAQGEYCLLLNSDTEVKSGSLEKLIEFAEDHPEAGIVGAKLLNVDGSIQPSIYHFPTLYGAISEYWFGEKTAYEKYALTASGVVAVEAVVGAAMLVPRKTIDTIGLLDERYFMYFEDLDYCRRAKKAGLKVYFLPEAKITHHHGASGNPTKTYQYLQESSKIYNGKVKYYLLTFILKIGQKWQKLLVR